MSNDNQNKYAQDGVNVENGDDFSAIAGKVCMSTYENNKHVKVLDLSKGHFRGKRAYRFQNVPEGYLMDNSSDGNGTKTGLTAASGRYRDSAKDMIAMVCGDMVAAGGMPLLLNNILDFSTLGEKDGQTFNAAVELLMGLKEVADNEHLILFKGETAELGPFVGSENPDALLKFNWGGTATGVTHLDKIITGETLAPGQIVIALREKGFRANGISSVRKALSMQYSNYGLYWWNNPTAIADVYAAAEPSVSYNNFILDLHGWTRKDYEPLVKLHTVAHVTGGGIKSKLIDDLLKPRGLNVFLDGLFMPPDIMQKCIKWRGMSIEESYSTWNMGQGMLIVINKNDVQKVFETAIKHEIEVQIAGEITDNEKSVIRCPYFKEKIAF